MATKKQLNSYAARMRSRPTKHELLTSTLLTQAGYRFLSQVVFGFYIVDFIIPSLLLAIEVDGSSHDNKQEYDKKRDEFIAQFGLSVLHVRNEDVASTLLPLISTYPPIQNFLEIYKTSRKQACTVHAVYHRPKSQRTPKKSKPKLCRKKKKP